MTNRSNSERLASRAEARRRSRLVARGELTPEPAPASAEPEARPRDGGFLRRLFPPAPPLPGRPDPLTGFDGSGPLRPVRERLFLLRQNLAAWLPTGIIAVIGYIASVFYYQGILGLVGMFVMFGAYIAAGWFGWQRPTLYGTAAGLVSYVVLVVLILTQFASRGAGPETLFPTTAYLADLVIRGLYQAGLGFIGGWYGGYLRRRQAQLATQTRRARR